MSFAMRVPTGATCPRAVCGATLAVHIVATGLHINFLKLFGPDEVGKLFGIYSSRVATSRVSIEQAML